MKIEISVYTESGTEITSSHRSSNGFVYSGYDYRKPIVYSSLPFELSDENKNKIKDKLQTYRWEENFEPDWGISFGQPTIHFSEIETSDFSDFLNSLNIPEVIFVPASDGIDGCLLNLDGKNSFTTSYKSHGIEWYFETLPILKKFGVNYRTVLNELLLIANQDISKFVDDNQFYLGRINLTANTWIMPAKICNDNGNLRDCIKNSHNEEVSKIRELIEQGYTYHALKNYSSGIHIPNRYEKIKFFEEHGAFSFI